MKARTTNAPVKVQASNSIIELASCRNQLGVGRPHVTFKWSSRMTALINRV